MGTNECSQPASKSPWDSQDFGDVNMVLKMAHFHKSFRPQWVKRIAHLSMMTSSNGNIFRVTGLVCGEFTGPVTRNFDVFYLRLNKRLSKQSQGWWFETLSGSLWRHCNESVGRMKIKGK